MSEVSEVLLQHTDDADKQGSDVHPNFEQQGGDPVETAGQSSLEPIIEGFSRRDTSFGAKWLFPQTLNPYPYRDYIRQLLHFDTRLRVYGKMCQHMTMNCADAGYSGLWQVVAVLTQMHAEFVDAAPFMQRLAWCLDEDIRKSIGSVVEENEEYYQRNMSPWTSAGKSALDTLVKHLVKASDKKDVQAKEGSLTVLEALQKLRSKTKKLGEGCGAVPDEDAHAQLEEEVQKHLLDPLGVQAFWRDSGFARAFCIGLADLWKQKDHKALVYIIRKAAWIDKHPQPKGPLAWVWVLGILAGPHMRKFKGDSDSVMVLTDKVNTVKTVIPRFQHMCMKLEKVIEQDLGTIGVLRIQICTTGAAFMVAVCNHLFPLLLVHFGLKETSGTL